jgi:hypothetical protein
LSQQLLRCVDVRLEADEFEPRHLIPPAETLASRFGAAQQVPRALQVLTCGAEVTLIQLQAGTEEGDMRVAQIISQLGRPECPFEIRVCRGTPEPPSENREE